MIKKKVLLAKDIMEKPVKILPTTKLKEIIKKLKSTENTLIVVDKGGQFLGEIHEFDLLKTIIPEDLLDEKEVVDFMGAGYDKGFFAKTAKDLMTKHEIQIDPYTSFEKIAIEMYRGEIKVVPVVKNKKIVGVVHVKNLIEVLD